MLAEPKLKTLQGFIETLTEEELIWINGYLSGLVSAHKPVVKSVPAPSQKITILYGTESGNSKKLATGFTSKAKKAGVQSKLFSLDQYRLSDLLKEEYLFVVISTQGEGEPPEAAKKFYSHLFENNASLPKLNFGVLALGDTAYPLFCKTGEDVDQRLEQLGGNRVVPLQKCDVDFDDDAQVWFENVLNSLTSAAPSVLPLKTKAKRTGKKNYTGRLLTNINLSGQGSGKQTHHLEIAADDLQYEPGDSIGVIPENPEAIVKGIIDLAPANKDKKIFFRGEEYAIIDLLRKKLNIVYLPERVVLKYAQLVQQEIPPMRIDLLNLLKIYPVKDAIQFEDVMSILEPTTPRLYSISSSPTAHEGEVHLTVCRDCFTVNDETHYGLCSDYFAQLAENSEFEFYIHRNSQFRLPAPDKDVIMIGPGTGIAPFRSFIAERDSTGAQGRNWLFFGEQRFASDFLYQTEIQNYAQTGILTKVSVAFSRDQKEKIYVQHRMTELGKDLFNWLEGGAFLYLCGSKDPMSVDVENTLLEIIQRHGDRNPDQAQAYLNTLKDENRYQRDVY
jgi:sulfite reductase (NADPH) flavoprotein alpha-component